MASKIKTVIPMASPKGSLLHFICLYMHSMVSECIISYKFMYSDSNTITVVFIPLDSESPFDMKRIAPIPIIILHTISPNIVPTIRLCLIPMLTVNIMVWIKFDWFEE